MNTVVKNEFTSSEELPPKNWESLDSLDIISIIDSISKWIHTVLAVDTDSLLISKWVEKYMVRKQWSLFEKFSNIDSGDISTDGAFTTVKANGKVFNLRQLEAYNAIAKDTGSKVFNIVEFFWKADHDAKKVEQKILETAVAA